MPLITYNKNKKAHKKGAHQSVDALVAAQKETINNQVRMYETANALLKQEALNNEHASIKIDKIYPAPFNEQWNSYQPLNSEKAYELERSIVDVGLLSPIVLWQIDKNQVSSYYQGDVNPYNFNGESYMVLSGHSRVNAYLRLYKATGDKRYLAIDAVIKKDLPIIEARYIIKVTNFASRQLSNEENRDSVYFMYHLLEEEGYKGSQIAHKIATDSGQKLRTVNYYLRINTKLIAPFLQRLKAKELTQTSAYKLSGLTIEVQEWLHVTYGDQVTDKVLQGLKPSHTTKKEIMCLFQIKVYGDTVTITSEIPQELEKKFKTMVSKWLYKQLNK